MILNGILAAFAILSLALTLWQWWVARRFPLHRRVGENSSAPAVTIFKPLKGCDEFTEDCLRSWLAQNYTGEIQILFAVTGEDDLVCEIVRKLLREFPARDAHLVICPERLGANAKLSKLAQLESRARHDIIVISDADVRVPEDFLSNAIKPLSDPGIGLVNCFYRLANPTTIAMQIEAVAINADFWSQVLQSKSLKPLDFALGAAMITRRQQLAEIGGFRALVDCLADDYQLGHRIAARGHRIELCPVVVECWSSPMYFVDVWSHQLRWARTIRVCQPGPYFASILSNATLWPALWALVSIPKISIEVYSVAPNAITGLVQLPDGVMLAGAALAVRTLIAHDLQSRLNRSHSHLIWFWLVPVKDILQFAIWLCAFAGNTVVWRGEKYRMKSDGTIQRR